jgi:hypothetical protein
LRDFLRRDVEDGRAGDFLVKFGEKGKGYTLRIAATN